MTIGAKFVGVMEAATFPAAEGARPQPKSIESFRDSGSSGRSLIRCDVFTMKTLIAFCAIASRSRMVKQRMG